MSKRMTMIDDRGLRIAILYLPSSIMGPLSAALLCLQMIFLTTYATAAAETLEQLIAEAKKEGEVTLMASASTFGGKKGFAELETAFNKKFGLNRRSIWLPGQVFRRSRPAL
jgi:hypothetical protein